MKALGCLLTIVVALLLLVAWVYGSNGGWL